MGKHIDSGPRERLKTFGASSLSDADLLALLLGSGYRGKDVFSLSEQLLGEFPIIPFLFRLDGLHIPGVGDAKLGRLLAVREILRRAFNDLFIYWLWQSATPITCFVCGEPPDVSVVHCTVKEDFWPHEECPCGWLVFHRHLDTGEPSACDQMILEKLKVRGFYVITADRACEIISKKTILLGG